MVLATARARRSSGIGCGAAASGIRPGLRAPTPAGSRFCRCCSAIASSSGVDLQFRRQHFGDFLQRLRQVAIVVQGVDQQADQLLVALGRDGSAKAVAAGVRAAWSVRLASACWSSSSSSSSLPPCREDGRHSASRVVAPGRSASSASFPARRRILGGRRGDSAGRGAAFVAVVAFQQRIVLQSIARFPGSARASTSCSSRIDCCNCGVSVRCCESLSCRECFIEVPDMGELVFKRQPVRQAATADCLKAGNARRGRPCGRFHYRQFRPACRRPAPCRR